MSTIEQIKELEAQKQVLLKQAKSESLAVINKQIETLNDLGFYFELTERTSPKRTRKKRKTAE